MTSSLGEDDRDALRALAGAPLRFDESMRRHTTLKIGGPCDAWFEPKDTENLRDVLRVCRARNIAVTAVGSGSNLLVLDGGIRGLVVCTRNLRQISRQGPHGIFVQSGVSTGKLLAMATRWELGGVEFLGGVPGSVGGGLVMNAGTYLGEFVDVTERVTSLVLASGDEVLRTGAECGFGYRTSILPADEVVVAAQLALTPRARDEIERAVKALRKRRKEREPSGAHNAGSAFKNPANDFAGRLIEACNLKGTRIGDAECSPVHANWFVNHGQASAHDVLQLLELARTRVKEQHGVDLQLEWKVLGVP